jgi:hypothetical protein
MLYDESADDLILKGAVPEFVVQDGLADVFTSGNVSSSLVFEARNSTPREISRINAVHESTNGTAGALALLTMTGDSLTEKMRVTGAGLAGIGTTAPASLLHLSANQPELIFQWAANYSGQILFKEGTTLTGAITMHSPSDTVNDVLTGDQQDGNMVLGTGSSGAAGESLILVTNGVARMTIVAAGTVNVVGTFTAGTKTFRIDHPLPAKNDTHYLLHSSIEGPQADLIYRGRADLVSGTVDVNIDTAAGMSEGTFELLCGDVQCFTSNEDGWTALKGSVSGNILTITAQDDTCTDTVSWMVIGERKDAKMIESEWADDDGKLIVETLKSEHE